MKVLLTQDVKGVGKAGDLAEVADGYARNYLVPRGLAVAATGGTVKSIEQQQAQVRRRVERETQKAQQLAARLEGQTVTIRARAGEGGRLFGSVTAADVAQAIHQSFGTEVDRRRVELEAPIKALGAQAVTLRLASGVTARLTVQVEPLEEASAAVGSEGQA